MSELNGIIQMRNPLNDASIYPVTTQDAIIVDVSSGKKLTEYKNEVDSSFEHHDSSITTLIERVDGNDSSINRLIERVDGNDSSINTLESDVSTLKSGVEVLENKIIIISDVEFEALSDEEKDPNKFYYVYEVVEDEDEEPEE